MNESAGKRMFLVYDTETTGLWKPAYEVADPRQPKIVQLSALLATTEGEIVRELNALVRPEGWHVDPGAEEIHGITTERLIDEGQALEDVLREFDEFVKEADRTIAYNLAFDEAVVNHCLKLIKRRIDFPRRVCAMMMAKEVLQIPSEWEGGGYKWPKLGETYKFLFGEEMDGAHDASVDTRATLKSYVEMKNRGVRDELPALMRKSMKVSDFEEDGRDIETLKQLVSSAVSSLASLSEWEKTFIADLRGRLDRFGDDVRMSEKQWLILERIGKVDDGRTSHSP